MTVIVIVEDGTIVSNANSYVSVAETDAYLQANIFVYPVWSALTSDEKSAVVVWASRYIDDRAIWNGYKTDNTSAMRWPRTGVYDQDGIAIGSHTIPHQLKTAVMVMASYLMVSDRALDRGTDGLTRLRVDVIELYFDSSYRLPEVPNELQLILRGLGSISSGAHNFGRIRKA